MVALSEFSGEERAEMCLEGAFASAEVSGAEMEGELMEERTRDGVGAVLESSWCWR